MIRNTLKTFFRANNHKRSESQNDKSLDLRRGSLKKIKKGVSLLGGGASGSVIDEEFPIIFPERIMTLRKDIDNLVHEESQARKYFERFKWERERKLQAMKSKNRILQKVNIDDALLGTNQNTITATGPADDLKYLNG